MLEIDCKSAELTIFLKGQRITIPDDVCTDICNALRYDFLIAERLEANSLLLFGGREWYAIDLNSFSYRQISKGIDLPGLDGSVSKVFSLNYIVVMCYAKAIVMDSDFFILAHMDYPLGLSRRLFMNLFSRIEESRFVPSFVRPMLERIPPLIGGSRSRHFVITKFFNHGVEFSRTSIISKIFISLPIPATLKSSFAMSWTENEELDQMREK